MLKPTSLVCLASLLAAAPFIAACDDDDSLAAKGGPETPDAGTEAGTDAGATPDAGPDAAGPDAAPEAGAEAGTDGGDGGMGFDGGGSVIGGLTVDTPAADQTIDLLGKAGHRIWIEVSEAQLTRINNGDQGGGVKPLVDPRPALDVPYKILPGGPGDIIIVPPPGGGDPGNGGDIYTPGGNTEPPATYADHVVVQDVATGSVADYGKLQVKIVGESTRRGWTTSSIPNVHIDTDEFQDGVRIGGFEHIRLNNGLVGSIFREHIAHRVFRGLGYPALRSTFAFFGSNVWGPETWIPMTLIEVYKERFCEDNEELLGGTCVNMWEYAGDLGNGDLPGNACQIKECNNSRVDDLSAAIAAAPLGPGFREALADIIDWPRFHDYQCIGWILSTGDDAVHATNNVLLMERTDGKLVLGPYSIDISAGQDWYSTTPLPGQSTIARGCQGDPACWADTIARCEDLVTKFTNLHAEAFVDDTRQTLTELGMMRPGDEQRADILRYWYQHRPEQLPGELERYRYLPDAFGNCPNGLTVCADQGCGTEEECKGRLCTPGTEWCETTGECTPPGGCQVCTEETPFYCPPAYKCLPSAERCDIECIAQLGAGAIYCEAAKSCTYEGECKDGGVIGGGDGGIIIDPPPKPRI